MANGRGGIIGGIITIAIGATVYSVNQAAVVENFSKDTGMSKQQAEQYVNNVTEDELEPYDKVGSDFISDGQDILEEVSEIDCNKYSYEWETNELSCEEGRSQLKSIGNDEIALGKAYTILASDTASSNDISAVIRLIDKLNSDYSTFEIVGQALDPTSIDELMKTNSYNKALLQAALDSK